MYDIQYQEEVDHGRDGIVYCGEVVSYADAERAAGGDTAETLIYEDEFFAELDRQATKADLLPLLANPPGLRPRQQERDDEQHTLPRSRRRQRRRRLC